MQDALNTWVIAVFNDGRRLWVDLGDHGVSRPCLADAYEREETSFVRRHLRKGDVFVDIGANIGWFSVLAARIVGWRGKVYAIEPRPDTFGRLAMSIRENRLRNVTVRNVALGPEAGSIVVATLTEARNPGGTWTLATEALHASNGEHNGYQRFTVRQERLDDMRLGRCSLIKIDIEGAEYLAMQGAMETLRRHRPIILSEVNPEPLAQVSRVSPVQYAEMLIGAGYRPTTLAGETVSLSYLEGLADMVNLAFLPA